MARRHGDESSAWVWAAVAVALGIMHQTRPGAETLSTKHTFSDWPRRLKDHLQQPVRPLDSRADALRGVSDAFFLTVRWHSKRPEVTHIGLLATWVRWPRAELSAIVFVVTSSLSFLAFSTAPGLAFRFFIPPHTGYARLPSFLLAPFAQTTLMGLVVSVLTFLSCSSVVQRAPATVAGALSLFVGSGVLAHWVATRIFDDRGAARVSSTAARLSWVAATAVREPALIFNVYGVQLAAPWACLLQAVLAVAENGGPSAGVVIAHVFALGLGAAYSTWLQRAS